jgi:hypothetical protein
MKRGDVVFSPHFKFANGGTSDKLLIVLNEATSTTPHLILLATSKQRNKKLDPGCHAKDGYFVIPPKTDWFQVRTWIMFNRVYEFDFVRELNEHFKGNLLIKTTLKENTIKAMGLVGTGTRFSKAMFMPFAEGYSPWGQAPYFTTHYLLGVHDENRA